MGRYDSDEDDDNQEPETPLIRQLRKQLKDAHRERDQYRTQIEDQAKASRTSTVEAVLKDRGLNPKIAALVPADLLDREAVGKWVADYADIFGSTPPADKAPVVDPEAQAALGRMDQATTAGASSATETLISRIQGMSHEDLLKEIERAQGTG